MCVVFIRTLNNSGEFGETCVPTGEKGVSDSASFITHIVYLFNKTCTFTSMAGNIEPSVFALERNVIKVKLKKKIE